MRYSPPKYFCALLIIFFSLQIVSGQLSKKHYIPPLSNSEFGNANPENQYIYISTPNNLNVNYTITPVGQPNTSIINGIVTNNNPAEIFLGSGYGQLFQPSNQSSTIVTDRGYIIEAEDVIYVSVRMRAGGGAQAGALVSKGAAGLGTVFRVGSYTNENPQTNYANFFSFMATENNTTVTIDDLPVGLTIKNYTGTFPITVNLNEGESYVVVTNSNESVINRDGLIGTLIESDKPIVVNSGSANGSFHNGSGRDYGIDQIVGFSKVGNEYIFVRGDGSDNFENILIVAHEDNTEISVNGGPTIATINAGEWHVIEGDSYNTNGNMYVSTSKNVFAYQGVGGNGNNEPNQGMFFVPPLSCNNRGDLNSIANIQNIGNINYSGGITIVTNKGSTVEINNQPIQNFTTAGPFDVDGNPDYVTYKVLGLSNNVSVLSTGELYCAYFNFNGVATSGSFYSGFPSPPEIDFDLDITAAGNCIPNITLEAFNVDVFDTVEWHYDNGTGYVPTGESALTYKPLQPGGYKLVGTITCSGLTFDSPAVRVSICPDDFDGDSVIDNVDVDIDNDGILNCDESLGNVNLDLSNINNPILNFQDGSNNSTFATGLLQTSSSSGNITSLATDTNGNFTTTIGSAITAELSYRIDFQNASNIKFQEVVGYTHTSTDGEVFSIIIGPSEQNITLLDPDNTILVDTDFDGVFEAGIDNFSTSEIRFRYNPTPNGNTPFQFVASHIDYVIFKHQFSNTTEQSSFQGNFSLTCFARDSDGDGNEDAFDLDSDNDGILDLLEASGVIISLSNNDTNFDGLDNIFNNIGVTPADSDNDGIPDYLDLDSDNDGIFDVFEAGHNLPDANLDGVIDPIDFGRNGLADALETFPDSFILSFVTANTDNDNLLNAVELDSDNDTCFDVLEAGFTDGDNDGIIANSPVQVDANGKVINTTDGYTTLPNSNYIIFAPILLNTPFQDVEFCEGSTSTISIDTTADAYQWEVSTDNGNTWSDIQNSAIYSGVTSNTLQITSLPLSFHNQQYRVYLERTGNSCSSLSNSITLSVSPLPIINSDVQLVICDDDTDGRNVFNLNDALPLLSTNYQNETFRFYPTLNDAQNSTNEIINPSSYADADVTSDSVWVSVTSTFGCNVYEEIDLLVVANRIPANFLRTFEECDDFLDVNGNDTTNNDDTDGITYFDFSAVNAEILSLFPPSQQLEITYYRTIQNAQDKENPITDISNYRNTGFPQTQQIYVRVENLLSTNCAPSITPSIQLNVFNPPQVNPASNIEVCDDDNDGFVQNLNLESRTNAILASQNPNLFTVVYFTSQEDARNNTNPITNPTSFTNTEAFNQTIYVRITNTVTGCFFPRHAFDIIVSSPPLANIITTADICDDNTDGSASNGFVQNIDLESYIPEILGNQNPNDFQVTFHTSEIDAQNGDNALSSPFTNTDPFQQTIYVRVRNFNTQCINTGTSFTLNIIPEPVVNTIGNVAFCDDNNDGIVSGINFDSYITSILNGLNPDEYTVSFHLSNNEAFQGSNPISFPFTNTVSPQTIYVRVTNNTSGCFNSNTSFSVNINPSPVLNTPPNLQICDDNTDGFVGGFDLESQTSIILNGLDPNLYTITYHESLADAEGGLDPLSSPFTNTDQNQQTIYVRITNTVTGCSFSGHTFDIIVSPPPLANIITTADICDDNTDGSASNGFVQNIDLESYIPEILGNQNPNDFQVTFHTSEIDAQNGDNALSSPFTNTDPFQQTIYVRVRNLTTQCINTDKSFILNIIPEPVVNTIGNVAFCDDNNDGIVSGINFDSYITSILNGLNPDEYTVSFHLSNNEAFQGSNPISFPFTNTVSPQTIYVRVTNNTSGCFNSNTSFSVNINPSPVLNTPPNLQICDDNTDGFVGGFDLESQTSIILNGLDPNLYTITYHESLADAEGGFDPLSSPFTNTDQNQQTIYVRGVNNNTQCATTGISFELIVNPLPIINAIDDEIACDEDSDGIVNTIDLTSKIPEILGSQDPNNHTVTFHLTSGDALDGTNQITFPFTNTTAFEQIIYVRVTNTVTTCSITNQSFTIYVNPIPTVQPIGDIMMCDNDDDGDDTNGFVQNIDLNSRIEFLLGPNQNINDFTVTFHESLIDAENGDNAIVSPYSNASADQQEIFIRIENNTTGCFLAQFGFNVIINPLPEFEVTTPRFLCLNGDPIELSVENPSETYDYFWIDADGNTVLGEKITAFKGGTYSVTATKMDETGCSRTRHITVNDSDIAVITDEDVIINDGSDNNSILINNNPGNLGIGDYEFALTDKDGNIVFDYQDEPSFGGLPGGIYVILVRDKNGCGEASLEVALIELPKFFTPNNDGKNDTWNVKGVTSEYFPKSKISVFNRFGKFLADFTLDHPGWNGRYNGSIVISNDYWARVELIDRKGKVRVETRNFALLRR